MSRGPQMTSALHVTRNELIPIRVGEADSLRGDCHAGTLICPVPGCAASAITTRSNYRNRWGTFVVDAFRHQRRMPDDDAHSPESLRHLDSKARIAEWMRGNGFLNVRLERTVHVAAPDGHGQRPTIRRPDVIGRHPNGTLVAVEAQVSPISKREWMQRSSELTRAGRSVLWLWCWPVRSGIHHAATTAVRAAADADIWFLDPHAENGPALGWAHQERTIAGEQFKVRPFDFTVPLRFDWHPLTSLGLNSDGTVAFDRTADESRLNAALAIEEAERAQAAEARKRAAAERERRILRAQQANERRVRNAETLREARRRKRAAHLDLPTDTSLDPDLVAVCGRENAPDDKVWVPVLHWKTVVTRRLIHRDIGTRVPVASIVNFVEGAFASDPNTTAPAVHALLRDLARTQAIRLTEGYVTVRRGRDRSADQAQFDFTEGR